MWVKMPAAIISGIITIHCETRLPPSSATDAVFCSGQTAEPSFAPNRLESTNEAFSAALKT